jgi:Protein of unknown function (DUF1376)
MVAYYQHNIASWMDGTEGLSDGEYRVYHVICELIYLNDGPILLHETGIAGRCHQHVLAFRRHFAKLIEGGKLALENGKIVNRRASSELERIRSRRRKPPVDPTQTPAPPPYSRTEVSVGSTGGLFDKPLKNKDTALEDVEKLPSSLISSSSKNSDSLFKEEESKEEKINLSRFEQFWKQYPHKVGKREAQKSFDAVLRQKRATFEDLTCGLERYIAKTDDRPWCNPATWLNQDRWQDEPALNGGRNAATRNGSQPSGREGKPKGWSSFALANAREASEKNR